MSILPSIASEVNQVSDNYCRLYQASQYPCWLEVNPFLSFARSSEGTEHKYSHDWQRNEIRRHVLSYTKGIEPRLHVNEKDVRGDRLTPYSRPGLFHLIELAMVLQCPIVVWDWTRLVTQRSLLRKLDSIGVDFVTIKPLSMMRIESHSERTRLSLEEKMRQEHLGAGNIELGRFLSREFIYRDEICVSKG